MSVRRTGITRIYLPRGHYAHLSFDDGTRQAACEQHLSDQDPRWHSPDQWYGTGTYQEAEKAKCMALCPKCVKIVESIYGAPEVTGPALPSAARQAIEE